MPRRLLIAMGVAVVSLTVLAFTTTGGAAPADKDDDKIIVPKDIKEALNEMVAAVAKGEAIDKETARFFKYFPDDLKKAMWIFKPRMKNGEGGFGVGKPGQYTPDGIEGIIITHGNPRHKPMTVDQLKAASADFTRLADVTLAMAELTYQYTPKKKVPMNIPKDWTKFTDDMKKGATDLKAALKANDPKATKESFTKLYASCTNCHGLFSGEVAAPEGPSIPKGIRKAITTMADAVAKGEKIDKQADAFFKDNETDLKQAMWIFHPARVDGTGGFGIGLEPGMPKRNRREELLNPSKPPAPPLTDAQLKAAAIDLNRLADITLAMAEVTRRYQPKHIIIGGPTVITPQEWLTSVSAMERGARDLKAAVKANNPNDVKMAFTKLYTSCTNCHAVFRD